MFVTFEGIEGAGKSTIARLVAAGLAALGHDVVLTREPGDNSLGRSLRPILLDARNACLCSGAELHLFLADRAQHLAEGRPWKRNRLCFATAIPIPQSPIRAMAGAMTSKGLSCSIPWPQTDWSQI